MAWIKFSRAIANNPRFCEKTTERFPQMPISMVTKAPARRKNSRRKRSSSFDGIAICGFFAFLIGSSVRN
jgi:hypothetical protein